MNKEEADAKLEKGRAMFHEMSENGTYTPSKGRECIHAYLEGIGGYLSIIASRLKDGKE